MDKGKTTRRVYSAEQLQRLRISCSQPKLREAIEELDGEDAELVKEHVLRGSKSWAAHSYRSRTSGRSLRVPSNKENHSTNETENSLPSSSLDIPLTAPAVKVLGEIAPNGQVLRPNGQFRLRPSPTPSLRRKKVEAIVKAHGSPQHIRVTAGGRIVPSEQSPLCHPRYGYSAIKANGGLVKFAPNQPMGKAQWTQATQNGFVAQDVNGRLCQIVNGTILPLNEVDGALRLYVPAPNLNVSSRGSSFGPPTHDAPHNGDTRERALSQSKTAGPVDPPIPAQTNALELEYAKLELELKELDKTEALHGRTMAKTARDALVGKRRELIVTLDSIRKAIKSIKSAPPVEAPLSPRLANHQEVPVSPPGTRLPAFLKQRPHQSIDLNMPFMPGFNQFFGMQQGPFQAGQYGSQPMTSPDAPFGQAYSMPPFFVPPPPFDGSMASGYTPFSEAVPTSMPTTITTQAQDATATNDQSATNSHVPQSDGANSIREARKLTPPRQSHAVHIKAPEPRPAASLKSRLNPMSPAYKPGINGLLKTSGNEDRPAPKSVKDRVPTPLSPMHQLRPSAAANSVTRASDGTISPTKKSPHLHSSSVSSFETVDFFPRNTREYSTRKYAYPQLSEDKENTAPRQSVDGSAASPTTPFSDQSQSFTSKATNHRAPAAPPGTPVAPEMSSSKAQRSTQERSTGQGSRCTDAASLPDRVAHNLSPKTKRRDFVFVEERPSQYTAPSSSSAEKDHQCRQELCVTSSPVGQLDFTEASTDWIQGYRAGLARQSVGSDRQGEFLDGYCAGLLKSKPKAVTASTGSPSRPISRRPSPALVPPQTSTRTPLGPREQNAARPPFEQALQSMDTLKEAVFAPQNENAILSPSSQGPHANEPPFHLGAWAKQHEQVVGRGDGLAGFPHPSRTDSVLGRHGYASGAEATMESNNHGLPMHARADLELRRNAVSAATSNSASQGMDQSSSGADSNRVSSMTSIDSNLYRGWPGYRVFSAPLEYKSASSIAQAAGLASGHFAHAQSEDDQNLAAGQRTFSVTSAQTMQHYGRFKEGSLDGITNPPNSPHAIALPSSPAPPGQYSPSRSHSKKSSPTKSISPAKVKFEHIAEKVGIKVTVGKKEDAGSPGTPPGKRNWRNVWLGGAQRKDLSKDDSTGLSTT